MKLTDRMQAVADLVTPGNTLCDVGCDHGYVPIYLVENGIVPSAIAMDINKGPLDAARDNVSIHKLSDKITLRLSDGLKALCENEAKTVVVAGMGGRLVLKIVEDALEKITNTAFGIKELILQPQSEIDFFRKRMTELGFKSVAEDMIEEDGKFYPMARYVYTGDVTAIKNYYEEFSIEEELINLYGCHLLYDRNSVLKTYLLKEKAHLKDVKGMLSNIADDNARAERERQIEEKVNINEKAIKIINRKEDF